MRRQPLRHGAKARRATSPPLRDREETISRDQLAANFITLIASKFCTPPPTRLVV